MKKTRKPDTSVERIEAIYASKGACRHCGGKIPCWSMVGDKLPLSGRGNCEGESVLEAHGC